MLVLLHRHGPYITIYNWFWLYEIFWCLAVVPVKISIALTVGRLGRVASGKRPYIITLYGLVTILALITIGGMFYIIFRCTPVSYAWNVDIRGGECQAPAILAGIYYATTAINILADWVCALLPIPLLWNAPLTRKAKLSIGFLLSLGVLASISACIRQTYTNALIHSHDRTSGLGDLLIWGYAEIGIGFFAGSLSSLRPLLMRRTITEPISEKDEGEQELYELPGDNPLPIRQDHLTPERPGNMSPVSREIESHLHRYIFEKPG
ncbi:hypothetical protein LTR78_002876 [Recurvomyces mirabilis]|uniref:Rhodopsin domain-containing protein n=1 Tax=Recurvomyces mirabilis TaxID=574656 RepID=A0AAE0WSS7_9PEZI|nr:hypothetical protein LTR78_002876 [Recurvomyces mirabilis]